MDLKDYVTEGWTVEYLGPTEVIIISPRGSCFSYREAFFGEFDEECMSTPGGLYDREADDAQDIIRLMYDCLDEGNPEGLVKIVTASGK